MTKEEKTKLNLDKQKVLLDYWVSAEKIELNSIGFFFGVIIIPVALKTTLSFNDWTTYALIVFVIALVVTGKVRIDHYVGKQVKIREVVEKIKI